MHNKKEHLSSVQKNAKVTTTYSGRELFQLFKNSVLGGIGWSVGVTIGFALISTILLATVNFGTAIPLIGNFLAQVVQETQKSLERGSH